MQSPAALARLRAHGRRVAPSRRRAYRRMATLLVGSALAAAPVLAQDPAFAYPRQGVPGVNTPGGTTLIRPELVDLDGDGDLDLLGSGRASGNARFFYVQNVGSASSPSYAAPVSAPFGLTYTNDADPALTVGDVDGDGDIDVLVGFETGRAVYFRNNGTRTAPAFAEAALPSGLTHFADPDDNVDAYPSPDLVDIDNDGDLDLYAGLVSGEIRYYQNAGSRTAPLYASPVVLSLSRPTDAAGATVELADLDNDGDLDLLAGFTTGNKTSATFYYYENVGTASAPSFGPPVEEPFGLDTGSAVRLQATTGDVDGDGDRDLIAGTEGSLVLYTNGGEGPQVNPFSLTPVEVGESNANEQPVLVDIDGDGDLDVAHSTPPQPTALQAHAATGSVDCAAPTARYPLGIQRNTGSAAAPQFSVTPTIVRLYSREFVTIDLDNDGDGDFLSLCVPVGGNTFAGFAFEYIENTTPEGGPLGFAQPVSNPFGLQSDVATPGTRLYAGDLDGDGDTDLLVVGTDFVNTTTRLFLNSGGSGAPQFGTGATPGASLVSPSEAGTLADVNGDGKDDLVTTFGDFYVRMNTTSPGGPISFSAPVTNPTPLYRTASGGVRVALGDLNGDGLTEAVGLVPDGDFLYYNIAGGFPTPVESLPAVPHDGTTRLSVRPNPATTEVRLLLQVATVGPVRVVLYDALGRTVATVFDGLAPANQPLDLRVVTAGLPAGVYVIHASGPSFVATRALTVVR